MSRAKKTCPCCKARNVGPIKTWRRMTQYNYEPSNWMNSCVHCIRNDDLYFAERWTEYHSGQGSPELVMPEIRNGRRPPIPKFKGTHSEWIAELFRDPVFLGKKAAA